MFQIRFLQTTASDRPELPFQAGQIITVPRLTAEMKVWLKPYPDGTRRAELLTPEPEAAVVGAGLERATEPRARGHR